MLPFFIEWSPDSVHPSTDAPPGRRLQQFDIVSPDPDEMSKTLLRIGIDAPTELGEMAQLRALITGPRGKLEVRS